MIASQCAGYIVLAVENSTILLWRLLENTVNRKVQEIA